MKLVSWLRLIMILLILSAKSAIAQEEIFNPSRRKIISFSDTLRLDTLSLQSGSLKLLYRGDTLSSEYFNYYPASAMLILNRAKIQSRFKEITEIEAVYKVFPINFTEEIRNKDPIKFKTEKKDSFNFYVYDFSEKAEENIFKFDGLDKNGSLSRGITVGNSQDLSVNSAFNLQLSGKIAGEIDVVAAITDENIPIQPEGNTQQLQDFDKVYIQLSKGRHKVIAGDYFINRPDAYFLNIYKRAQGLQIGTAVKNENIFKKNSPKGEMRVNASGAIARGKFTRNNIQGIEGNQGPYRLTGQEGEPFIIILSGSERVFIDGQLLKRGQENDYIIDYNVAEITFTARRLITKDVRIAIEFEYSDRNYARTMYHINNEWDIGNFKYKFNVFSEQDSKNQPLQQSLSQQQKDLLGEVGDSVENAISPTAVFVNFNKNEVLYKRIDTLVGGITDTIFVYSTNPDSARWRVTFSDVGEGKGSYKKRNSTANGTVYEYVGKNQGRYLPVIKLIAPKLQRMITFSTEYAISKSWSVDGEVALSTKDQNTFSSIGNRDNTGYAYRININNKSLLNKNSNPEKALTLNTRIWYEQVDRWFTPFIRFRNVEFARDWNLQNLSVNEGIEFLPGVDFELTKTGLGKFSYGINGYLKGSEYNAFRNQATAVLNKKGWKLNFWGSQISTSGPVSKSLYLRHRTRFSKDLGPIALGFISEDEFNIVRSASTDSVRKNSYMFNDWMFYLGNSDSSKVQWKIFYRPRLDNFPFENRLKAAAIGQSAGVEFGYQINQLQNIKFNLSYRKLDILDTLLFQQKAENTILGRLEYNARIFKNAITLNLFYETSSGLENQRQFSYIPVNNGQGTHYWDSSLDYNGNGVPDLDEFQQAQFSGQGNYIKVFTPTAVYVKTYNNQFNQSLNIKAPDHWKQKGGFRKFISRISNQTVYRNIRKTQSNDLIRAINPFDLGGGDSSLLSMSSNLRNTLFFNKNDSKYGFDINYNDTRSKILLTNGIDSRTTAAYSIRSRYSPHRKITINFDYETGKKLNQSEFLRQRDFLINYYRVHPAVVFQPNSNVRITLLYKYGFKFNSGNGMAGSIPGGQIAKSHQAGLEVDLNFLTKGLINMRLNFIRLQYNDLTSNALAFEMLDALAPGNNGTWSLSVLRTLGQNLQLSINYEGRAGNFKPIHVGGVQLRAFF